jgi:hypothetical protein
MMIPACPSLAFEDLPRHQARTRARWWLALLAECRTAPDTLFDDRQRTLIHDELPYQNDITAEQLAILNDLVLRLRASGEARTP